MTATDRYGNVFSEKETVFVKSGYHSKMDRRRFIIETISDFGSCESGSMIQLIDEETGNLVKRKIDTNWLLKIKN
jgi:hypothetical protein